ncbi:MAG: RHS repeat-associated core domain-containing protein [Pyrinomonadaceae bacterium]
MVPQTSTATRTDATRAGAKRSLTPAVVRSFTLILMLWCFAAPAQSQADSCLYCKPRVWVGFNGGLCSSGRYRMYVEGIQVLSGSGDCTTGAYERTGDVLVGLVVDYTYHLEVVGACATHINFYDIPEDYKLEINGREVTTIDKAGSSYGEGDGVWEIVVRRRCNCDNGNAGESAGPKQGSVMWNVGLGSLSDGRSAGSLSLHAENLASYLYTPVGLIYSPPGDTDEVDVVRDAGGSLRQIKTPEALADVVTLSATQYEVRYYRQADVGAKDVNGVYAVSNLPFVTWQISNPHVGFTDQLRIAKIQNGVTDASLYTWDSVANVWTLSTGGGARNETKTTVTDPITSDWTETFTVTDSAGIVVSKVARTYHRFPWKEELIKEVTDPDGAALTTSYEFYQNSGEAGRFRRLKSVVRPDGSWEQYDYDATGNRILVLRPWKDQAQVGATEANSYAVRTTYSNYDGIELSLHAKLVSAVEEKVAGVTVRKTTYTRAGTTINGEPAVVETETNYSSASAGEVTIRTTYHSTASDFYANRPSSVQYPDGRKDTYTYERGDYVPNADPALSQFTPSQNGPAQRLTVVHGTNDSPDGVVFKSTKQTTVLDQFGHAVLSETYVYTGGGSARVGWSVMTYDDRGHLTQTRHSNGSVVSSTWAGDRKTADSDETGVETVYTYDSLNRVKTMTRKGVASSGGFPAQPDVVTLINYDAEGRVTGRVTSASGLTLSSATSYDGAGRTKVETDQAGLSTTRSYTNGGRTETTTLPGGATQVIDKYLDGHTKSILGTAVVGRFFDYGANADGTSFTQEFTGSGGSASPRWTKTTSDMLGRQVKIESPAFAAGSLLERSLSYNPLGQLRSESAKVGALKLRADTLYEYDALGNRTRAGLDLNGDGVLSPASADRISEMEQVYQQTGTNWFKVSTSKVYLRAGDATATTTSIQSWRLTNFAVNGAETTIADVATTDVAGRQTSTTKGVDRAAKKVTVRTVRPESATPAVSVSYNGLLQASSPSTPVAATAYTYDALGRQTGSNDLAAGSSTRAYDPTTGRVTSESHGSQTTGYEYYPSTGAAAGRLKVKTDPAGKKAFFSYSSRGELLRTWGDTAYPVEYVYDAYGQKTELHSFRDGAGWQGNSWPSAATGTADVTRWVYQEATGLLTQQRDASGKQVAYSYDPLGRVAARTWARLDGLGQPIVTTYSHDPLTAEMLGVSYSDGTPAVTYTYDRGGRRDGVNDASGSHTLAYTDAGQLRTDQVVGGVLDGVAVTIGYDGFLRRESLQGTRGGTNLAGQTYGYDTSSRLQTVTSGGQTATYAYFPSSGLLSTTTFTGGTQLGRTYDSLGRLQSLSTTTPASGTVASYTYAYNSLDQRTRATREDNSYWSYSYNDRGELTSGKRYWSDNTAVAGQQAEHVFDNSGNRVSSKAGGDAQGLNLRQATYTPNSLNQYQQRTVPGAVDVTGTADPTAVVTVNDLPTYRRGDYFRAEVAVDNASAPAYPQMKAVGVKAGAGAGGLDVLTESGGHVFVAKAVETYAYDADGNLLSDGRWQYAWDGENRLASMQATAAVPTEAKLRLEFTYDCMGRRVQKKVYTWNVATASYQLQSTAKMIYDGWNLIAELDGSNNLIRSHVWGAGGLLLTYGGGNVYQVGYDGNQNVVALVNAGSGALSASYDYDPFGQTLRATGDYAAQNPLRFSGKYLDAETGLLYYGYRYYNPQTGRWLSRDPSGEMGGLNLYGFIQNDGVNSVDFLGLWKRDGAWKGKLFNYSGSAIAEACDSLSHLAELITGDGGDSKFLGISANIVPGQRVNVAPLLKRLETKLRDSVVRATGLINTEGFGEATVTVTEDDNPASSVEKYFSPTPFGRPDCDTATRIVLAKGLLDVVGPAMFNKLGYSDGNLPLVPRFGPSTSMLLGDTAWFPNYGDYLEQAQDNPRDQAFQAENVIKVGAGKFWGFLGGKQYNKVLTAAGWRDELRNAYYRVSGVRRRDNIPGWDNLEIRFLDTATLATQMFEERNKK